MAPFKFAQSVGFAAVILVSSFAVAQGAQRTHARTRTHGQRSAREQWGDDSGLQVNPGDDVTLPCSAGDGSIRAVEWTRPDLEPEYVLFYRDERSDTANQHPSFKGRVDLTDREMKNGNVSLLLKNVSISDSGTYECRVAKDGPSRRKRANIDTDPIRTIQLEVTVSGTNSKNTMDGNKDTTNRDGNKDTTNSDGNKDTTNSDGNTNIGLTVGLPVVVLICLAVVVVGVFLWKKRRHTDSKSEPAADKAVGDQLL